MLNPYLIQQLHTQREAELEQRLTRAWMLADARSNGRAKVSGVSEVREHVAAALVALASRIAPSQPAARAGRAAHVL